MLPEILTSNFNHLVLSVKEANPIWIIIATGVAVQLLNWLFTRLLPGAYTQQQQLIYESKLQSNSLATMAAQLSEVVEFRREMIVVNERITSILAHNARMETRLERLQEDLRLLRDRTQHLEWQIRQPESSRSGHQRAE